MSATRNSSGPPAGAAAGIDEGADVGLARGHHAVERRGDVLEACQRLQAIESPRYGYFPGYYVHSPRYYAYAPAYYGYAPGFGV
jgi:hypothetical protein